MLVVGGEDEQVIAWWTRRVPQPGINPKSGGRAGTPGLIEQALEDLPARQRLVVTMRDVQGADEMCELLDLSPGNQRMLLHRGRGALRAALEEYYRA